MYNVVRGIFPRNDSEENDMSRRMTSIGTLAAVFCILIISATPAMATDVAQRSQVAQIDVRSTGISWQPLINFKSAVLTVSGPDGAFLSREFNRGESIQMPVVDILGIISFVLSAEPGDLVFYSF